MADTRQINEHAHESDPPTKLRRRGLVAGAAALVAGVLAQRTATPVAAAHQTEDLGIGSTNPTTGANPTTSTALNAAVSANTGLWVKNNFSATADAYPDGIQGYAGGANNAGVFGRDNDTNGIGVSGAAPNGLGVFGGSTGGTGVAGNSSSGSGLYGQSTTGAGVYGMAGSVSAWAGYFNGQVNVATTVAFGLTGSTTSAGYGGVLGSAAANNTVGIYGSVGGGTTGTYAGWFAGPVVVAGSLAVSGTKNAAVLHPDGTHRLLHCMEAPEAWFEDFGAGKLVDGKGIVPIDPDFAAVSDLREYHVFVTPKFADGAGLAVVEQRPTSFTVMQGNGGTSTGSFSWRLVARRKDVKAERFTAVAMPKMAAPGALARTGPPVVLPAPKLPNRK